MKEQIWLSVGTKKDTWCFALARFEDGSIRVVEHLMKAGFVEVGNRSVTEETKKPCRLFSGSRKLIVRDLYSACCKELGIKPERQPNE